MRIDFVSDIASPWCAVGLNALEQALARIGSDVAVELSQAPDFEASTPNAGAS